MDDTRKLALDHAVTLTPVSKDAPLDPDAVVAAAEKFLAFLNPLSQRLADVRLPVRAPADLARADQTPVADCKIPDLSAAADDDAKTRIVRPT